MIVCNSPKQYHQEIEASCLSALRHHCAHSDPMTSCDGCPWGPCGSLYDPCDRIFLDLLPDILRSRPDDRSLRLADQLDQCRKYDHETCQSCRHFLTCYANEDLDPMLKDVYDHLCSVGAFAGGPEE